MLIELPSSIGVKATAVIEAEAEHLPHTLPVPADGGTAKLNTAKARHKVSHKKSSLSRYREIYMFNSLRTFHCSYISFWLKRQPLNFCSGSMFDGRELLALLTVTRQRGWMLPEKTPTVNITGFLTIFGKRIPSRKCGQVGLKLFPPVNFTFLSTTESS